VRILFAGTPQPAADTLAALLRGWDVAGVITRPDAAVGRSKKPVPSAVAAVAQAHGVPVLKTASAKTDETCDWVRGLAPDVAVVVAYGGLIPQRVLEIPAQGWLNIHYSLLPRWRGAAPVQAAILAGDESTGVTVFRLVPELDAGPVLAAREHRLAQQTAGELLEELTQVGIEVLLDEVLPRINGLAEQPQTGEPTYAGKITTAAARIDWARDAAHIARAVRAYNPAPAAWTLFGDPAAAQRLRVLRVHAAAAGGSLAPGEVAISKREVRVGTGAGELVLDEVQPPGKPVMRAADWGRGLHVAPVFT
jgi:methionyl-tRNA formyltransferase